MLGIKRELRPEQRASIWEAPAAFNPLRSAGRAAPSPLLGSLQPKAISSHGFAFGTASTLLGSPGALQLLSTHLRTRAVPFVPQPVFISLNQSQLCATSSFEHNVGSVRDCQTSCKHPLCCDPRDMQPVGCVHRAFPSSVSLPTPQPPSKPPQPLLPDHSRAPCSIPGACALRAARAPELQGREKRKNNAFTQQKRKSQDRHEQKIHRPASPCRLLMPPGAAAWQFLQKSPAARPGGRK